MIDIHNHILIEVDDGPKSKQDMLNLLRQGKDEGVKEVIVTPHHLSPLFDNEYIKVREKLQQLLDLDEVDRKSVV